MSQPVLSFVVVAFENTRALRTCLSSLLDQTLPPEQIEVIVVDNTPGNAGANQNRELCLGLDPRIRYEWTAARTVLADASCRHSRCLYVATEIGAKLAVGDFLCFPSADSYYAPVFAERMLAAAAATDSDLLHCDFVHGLPGRKYRAMESACYTGRIDKTSFILRRSCFAGFPDKHSDYETADGLLIEKLVGEGVSRRRVAEVLCFHN